MRSKTKQLSLILLLIGLIIISLSIYVVNETERAIVLRLGKMITVPDSKDPEVLSPGLRFKVPFIDSVRFLDKRIQTLDISSSRIPGEKRANC